ncbi:hypothetical protein HYN56_03335 [Flavobacterium crocinum]|uniref:Uncharacterized protein n=1 Tax=Flavobacterium crocinum TaxID=2183896 RepID=A0A2S1YGX3_9FLAO|nr:hypothetical protein HYN56_03335 [Flavobacterium crocinum]
MYKQNKQTRLEQSKRPLLHWIKRKFIIIITAFMLSRCKNARFAKLCVHKKLCEPCVILCGLCG